MKTEKEHYEHIMSTPWLKKLVEEANTHEPKFLTSFEEYKKVMDRREKEFQEMELNKKFTD